MAMIGGLFLHLLQENEDALITKKVNSFGGKCFAINADSELYGELSEINGFKFLNFKILGPLYVHIYNGCKVGFESNESKHEIESDSLEIHTDYSNKLKIGITSFDIDLDEELENILRKGDVLKINILINKKELSFEPNQNLLLDILDTKTDNEEANIDETLIAK